MKTTSLANCTYRQLLKLRRDNYSSGNFSIMTDTNKVWISEQKMGESRKQGIEISRERFNQLLKFYNRQQIITS